MAVEDQIQHAFGMLYLVMPVHNQADVSVRLEWCCIN
jgi:hypothetical protein